MKRILFTFLLMAGCAKDQPRITETLEPFGDLMESYYQDRIRFMPFEATAAGNKKYNDTIPLFISDTYQNELKDFYQRYLDEVLKYDSLALTEDESLYRNVLLWEIQTKLAALQLEPAIVTSPLYGMPLIVQTPIDQINGFHLYISQLAGGGSVQPFETTADYYNWLSRLEDYIVWLNIAQVQMRDGINAGFTLPDVIVKRIIDQLEPFISTPVEEHVFYRPIRTLSNDLPPIEHELLPAKYSEFIRLKMIPAYTELRDFLENEYLPACTDHSGIGELPNGNTLYRQLVKIHTTTDLTPDSIFNLGLAEVQRISGEMEAVKEQLQFNGTLQEFFNHVRNNPSLKPYSEPEEVIAHFEEIHERMKPYLSRLFNLTPKSGFEIRRTQSFREASASAEYMAGSIDGTRPGIFYVPIPSVTEYNNHRDESLFLHEAIPGHHYQLSLQQENKDLPRFMHTEGLGVFVEGWALYSESLGKELGLYTDPYQYFGMLSAEMHRAIRLVVDVGIHHKGWSREEAIQYSLANEPASEASIISEIERYMVSPGQALSYKIGQLKISELRKRAEEQLGDRFDIREFHDQVLGTGSLPLILLEEKINRWINEKVSGS